MAQETARSPQQTKPRRPVLEGVIDINEHRRPTLELVHARGETGCGIGQMVEDAEAVTEVHAVVGQRHGIERRRVELHVAQARKALLRDAQRGGAGVDAVEAADARRDQCGPTSAAAAGVEADGIARQTVPGEEGKIFAEPAPHFGIRNTALVEALPFAAEIVDSGAIEVVTVALHCCVICENSPLRVPSPRFWHCVYRRVYRPG